MCLFIMEELTLCYICILFYRPVKRVENLHRNVYINKIKKHISIINIVIGYV